MKILMVSNGITRAGGAEEYLADVCVGLKNKGHEVLVIYGESAAEEAPKLVEILPISKLVKDFNKEEFVKAADEFKPNVINFQNIISPKLLELATSKFPTTVFVHDHQSYCPGNSKYWFNSQTICNIAVSEQCLLNAYAQKCMTRRPVRAISNLLDRRKDLYALKKLSKVLCNSNYVKQNLILNGVNGSRIIVNNLFPRIWTDANYNDPNATSNSIPLVLFVGRLFKEKGVDHLLNALQQIKTPWKAVIAGDGWETENLVKLAKDLSINTRVEFTGFVNRERLRQLYSSARLVVVPSLWPEPFGLIGLEAFSFGKPVVAYNSGGITDWLQEGEGGILAEQGNIAELSSKIGLLLSNHYLAQSLGERGKSIFEKRFTLQRHLDKLLEVYEQISKQ